MSKVLKLIQDRHSARMAFDPDRPVAQQDLRQILEAGRWAPTAHNMQNFQVIVVDNREIMEATGNIERPISDTFVRENYQQLSFSEQELLEKKTGLPASLFPPAWRTPNAECGPVAGKERIASRFRTCPVLLIVLYDPSKRAPASEGDFLGIMSLGCIMENMWLMAQSLGIGFHVITTLSGDPVEKEVKALLRVPDGLKIAFAVRLGYPLTSVPKSLRVRRDVEDFTYHNGFDQPGLDQDGMPGETR